MKTVISVFTNRDQAERAVEELRQKGFEKEISILARDEEGRNQEGATMGTDNVADGPPPAAYWEDWPAWLLVRAP